MDCCFIPYGFNDSSIVVDMNSLCDVIHVLTTILWLLCMSLSFGYSSYYLALKPFYSVQSLVHQAGLVLVLLRSKPHNSMLLHCEQTYKEVIVTQDKKIKFPTLLTQ